jgi:anti-sigma factor RsiW
MSDPTITRHLENCAACQAEVAQLQEATRSLRAEKFFERRAETPDCLDELLTADFVEGRLPEDQRASVVTHLLACPRCRSVVAATGRLLADDAVTRAMPSGPERGWKRWSLPLGLAAAAAVVLLVWPRSAEISEPVPGLRDSAIIGPPAPIPISPRESAARVDRFVWSMVAGVERYRLRLYDAEGTVLWTAETGDTIAVRPDSVSLAPGATYLWRVEAQTEWQRWSASDLVEFQRVGATR